MKKKQRRNEDDERGIRQGVYQTVWDRGERKDEKQTKRFGGVDVRRIEIVGGEQTKNGTLSFQR